MNAYLVVSHFQRELPDDKMAEIMKNHLAYFKKALNDGKVIVAGPHVWADGSIGRGGVIVLSAASKDEAAEIMRNDPLAIADIIDYTISEFKIVNIRPELNKLAE